MAHLYPTDCNQTIGINQTFKINDTNCEMTLALLNIPEILEMNPIKKHIKPKRSNKKEKEKEKKKEYVEEIPAG